MADALIIVWLLVAALAPLPVGVWAYRRSDRRPLLVIPMAMVFVPIGWFVVVVLAQRLFDTEYSPWTSWVPVVLTTLVIVEGVRRLERQLS